MAIDLSFPFDDRVMGEPEQSFLQGLQANILKGHGREHVVLLFLEVKDAPRAREFIRGIPVTSAGQQFKQASHFNSKGIRGDVVKLLFMSYAALELFGHGEKFTEHGLFRSGMATDAAVLDGGTTESWQPELRRPLHVLHLLAHHDEVELARIAATILDEIETPSSGLEVVFVQPAKSYKNSDGVGVEHFGYVDGRSQPRILRTEIEAESSAKYDASAPLGQFVVVDPLHPDSHGSFLVFRKLEQNVAAFKRAARELALSLGLSGTASTRVDAQIVGRFRDGTPMTLHGSEQGMPVLNDFNYQGDAGFRCPLHAHIRKAEPRGSSPAGLAFERRVRVARRGVTYGTRNQDPDSGVFLDTPNDGVGLLFMCYQASIEQQYHFMQTEWLNDENFPRAGVGIDPLVGQGASHLGQLWRPEYDSMESGERHLVRGFVTLKGGEYFYAPSLPALRNL